MQSKSTKQAGGVQSVYSLDLGKKKKEAEVQKAALLCLCQVSLQGWAVL